MKNLALTLCLAYVSAMAVATPISAQSPDDDKVFLAQEVDIKAKIKNKLDSLPTKKSDCPESVQVILNLVLRKTGKVTDITVLQSSGCSYDREAIKAASKLKFDPAVKDGQPVSQYSEIIYKTRGSPWRDRTRSAMK